jgi:hypothetical protein
MLFRVIIEIRSRAIHRFVDARSLRSRRGVNSQNASFGRTNRSMIVEKCKEMIHAERRDPTTTLTAANTRVESALRACGLGEPVLRRPADQQAQHAYCAGKVKRDWRIS